MRYCILVSLHFFARFLIPIFKDACTKDLPVTFSNFVHEVRTNSIKSEKKPFVNLRDILLDAIFTDFSKKPYKFCFVASVTRSLINNQPICWNTKKK